MTGRCPAHLILIDWSP